MKIKLYSVIGCDPNVEHPNMIRHFMDYYVSKGVDEFNFVLQSKERTSTHIDTVCSTLDIYSKQNINITKFNGSYRKSKRVYGKMMKNESLHYDDGDWAAYADLDEFINVGNITFKEFLSDKQKYNCVCGVFRERISSDFCMKELSYPESIHCQYSMSIDNNALKKFNIGGKITKVCFSKFPYIVIEQHHHYPVYRENKAKKYIPNIHDEVLNVDHYRFTSMFISKYTTRWPYILNDSYTPKTLIEKRRKKFILFLMENEESAMRKFCEGFIHECK